MRCLRLLLLAPLMLVGLPTQSQVADLSRATCGQLLALSRGDQGQLLLWLHGYYAGAAQRMALDRGRINEAAEAMLKACQAKVDLPLMGAEARELLLGNTQAQVPANGTGVAVTTGTLLGTSSSTPAQAGPPPAHKQPSAAPLSLPGVPRVVQ
jgi:hypothetical protein